jgi:hypothetical protein
MRFAQSKFPINQRLKGITTDRGTYTLNYTLDTLGLVSELASIHYCTGATCLKDLTFTWNSATTGWAQTSVYDLPAEIPTGHGLVGTQFIDLDGDGRVDLVYASRDSAASPLVSRAWLKHRHRLGSVVIAGAAGGARPRRACRSERASPTRTATASSTSSWTAPSVASAVVRGPSGVAEQIHSGQWLGTAPGVRDPPVDQLLRERAAGQIERTDLLRSGDQRFLRGLSAH